MIFPPFALRRFARPLLYLLAACLPFVLCGMEAVSGQSEAGNVHAESEIVKKTPANPVPGEAPTQIIYLVNGDRLTGRILEKTDTHLHVETDFGELRIPLDRIARETEDRYAEASITELPPVVDSLLDLARPTDREKASPEETGEPDVAAADPEEATKTRTIAEEILASPPPPREEPPSMWDDNFFFRFLDRYSPIAHWDSQLQFGLVMQSGAVDQRDYSVRFVTQNRSLARREVRFEASWDYSLRRNDAGDRFRWRDRRRALLRYRYDLGDRFFFQSITRYNSEFTQGIRHAIDESVGIGYTFLDTRRFKGAVTPTIGAQYRDIRNRPTEWSGILSLFQDLEYRISSRTKLTQNLSITYYPAENNEISTRFITGLENQLSDRLRLNLRYEYSYDQTVANRALRRQQLLSFALGTTF